MELLQAVEGQRGRAPVPLTQQVGQVGDGRPQPRAPRARPAQGGTDVVGVDVGVVPDALHSRAQRPGDVDRRRPGPRRVVEGGADVARHLGRGLQLVGQLVLGATGALGHLAGGAVGGGELGEATGGDVGDGADDVGAHVGHRPPFAPRRRAPTGLIDGADKFLEPGQLGSCAGHDLGAGQGHGQPPTDLTYGLSVSIADGQQACQGVVADVTPIGPASPRRRARTARPRPAAGRARRRAPQARALPWWPAARARRASPEPIRAGRRRRPWPPD